MPRKEDDSLGREPTRTGEPQTPKPSDTDQSLGGQSTSGGNSSMADPGGGGLDMEVVDLARYTIEGVLGKGGMGEVQLATDTRLGRKVAIKRMLGEVANNRTAVSRFIAEAKAIAQLDHDNIVDIYDYGRAADGPVLIMQYIDGGSLLDCCREGALPLEKSVELTCQLCGALEMAHAAGIIHRDIKPANVLMTKEGSPRLTDFGLVRDTQADHGQTMAGAVLGTLDFMPPEQRRDAALVDARSDLWALAATLYQMVTGEPPRVIDLDTVPQQLRQTLAKALKSKKEDRYQTAAEFRDALRDSLTASAPEVALSAGECPQCHAKNKSNRKFCRGCGSTLVQKCLSCTAEIPIWENFCAECGGNQKEFVAARRAELDAQRAEAESLLREHAFADSLRIAKEIAAVEDSRLQHLREWAETFIESTEGERFHQKQTAENHYFEAQTHRKAFDYPAAIRAIKQIPEPIRSDEASSFLRCLESDLDSSNLLFDEISKLVNSRTTVKLPPKITAFRSLRGSTAALENLLSQLKCPECGTPNTPGEDCCRSCRNKLASFCLACLNAIPVWDECCGECGSKQKELIEAKIEELERESEKAEAWRAERRFEDAIDLAKRIQLYEIPRSDRFSKWAQEFILSVERELVGEKRQLTDAIDKIRGLLDQNQITQACKSAEQPVGLDLELHREFQDLANGLIAKVCTKTCETVASLLENGNFVRAIKTLLDVPDKLRDMEWSELAHKAKDGFASQLVEMWKNNEALFLEQVDWFLERFPEDSRALNLKAKALYSYERYEEAGKCFETLMKLEPDKHVHINFTAMCAHRCGDVTKPIKLLEQALQLKQGPGFNLIFYNLGCYYALQDRKKESIAMLSKAYEAGYRKASSYLEDPDLENVRYERDFVKLLKKGLEISFFCPGCKDTITVSSSLAGKIVMCTKCGANMNVPKMKQEHFLKRIWRLGW